MGTRGLSAKDRAEYLAESRRIDAEQRREAKERRMRLAEKIVMAVVDKVNQVVVRPGPDPEERECYDMAREIRDLSPNLADLVERILKVQEDEAT